MGSRRAQGRALLTFHGYGDVREVGPGLLRDPHGRQQGPAVSAGVHDVVIGAPVQAIMQQVGGPVSQKRVPLHLAEPNPAAELAPLYWLVRERVDRARGPHLSKQVTPIMIIMCMCISD